MSFRLLLRKACGLSLVLPKGCNLRADAGHPYSEAVGYHLLQLALATCPMKDEDVAGWKRNAALASLLVLSLQGFAARIIRHVQGGGILDDAALTAIKDDCITGLKNMETTGLLIETEADVFREAIAHLEQIMDRAIAEARQADND